MPFLRYYTVFNIEQAEGVEVPKDEPLPELSPIAECERIAERMPNPPKIEFDGGNRAFYRPLNDSVHLPLRKVFLSAEEYYSTLFHELVHSTGHGSRLNRPGIQDVNFGSEKYSKEELIAEIGAAFLCGTTGIEKKTIQNSAAYVQNWLNALKDDKKLVVLAAAQAQKAVDYVTGQSPS